MSLYIFDILLYYYKCLCTTFLLPLRFGLLLVLSLFKKDYFCVSFWLQSCCGKWEDWAPVNRFNHTSGMTAVIPTDRPKSARNRFAIKVLWRFLWCQLLFGFFCECRGFDIELSQISSFLLLTFSWWFVFCTFDLKGIAFIITYFKYLLFLKSK